MKTTITITEEMIRALRAEARARSASAVMVRPLNMAHNVRIVPGAAFRGDAFRGEAAEWTVSAPWGGWHGAYRMKQGLLILCQVQNGNPPPTMRLGWGDRGLIRAI